MALIAAGAIIGGYFLVVALTAAPSSGTQYQTARAKEGTITKTVSGSGQTEDVNQVTIKADTSGEVSKIYVGENEAVTENELLFQLDTADYNRTVQSAQIDLEKAQLQLETLQNAPDASKILAAQDAVTKAQNDLTALKLKQKQDRQSADDSKESAEDHLADLSESDPNYDTLYEKYTTQLTTANQTLEDLDKTGPADINQANATIKEKQAALDELKAGATDEEIRSQQLAVEKAQNDLSKIQAQAKDYQVRAPFSGVITAVNVAVGDSVSGGGTSSSSSTTTSSASAAQSASSTDSTTSSTSSSSSGGLATLVTGHKQAAITVNEVDRPSLKLGQKAKLTFDAITDLTLDGTVTQIDADGAASSGVVSYGVTVALDDQNNQIQNGMSVSAEITVGESDKVIVISSAAIKSRDNGQKYVEVMDSQAGAATPRQVTVEVGLTNDTESEITSGLKAGDLVVTSETSASTATSNSPTTNSTTNSTSRNRDNLGPLGGGGF